MRFARDKNNRRVFIDDTHIDEDYHCPICEEILVLRKGDIRAHCFAHKANTQCTDRWHYDKSLWHTNWQNRFPLEFQEIVKEYKGKKHRADVLIEELKTVIEFQHSAINASEFDERNKFYNDLGYRVVWLFDISEAWDNDAINQYDGYKYEWSRGRKALNNFSVTENKNVEIYVSFQVDAIDNEILQNYLKRNEETGVDDWGPDVDEYIFAHKYDKAIIKKLSWNQHGFEKFYTIHRKLNTFEFIKLFDVNEGKSIYELWNIYKPNQAIFMNIESKNYIKIIQDPNIQYSKYKKVKGYFSKNQYQFNGSLTELYYLSNPVWKCVWKS